NGGGRCGVCLPQARRCSEHAVTTCGADGEWSPPVACAVNKPVCAAGACTGVVDVQSGGDRACARFDNGSVRCWGNAHGGLLGGGGLASAEKPPWAGLFSMVRGNRSHLCGIGNDGKV